MTADVGGAGTPKLPALRTPAGQTVVDRTVVDRTVSQGPPRKSSMAALAAAAPAGRGAAERTAGSELGARRPFQTYEIDGLKMVLADPDTVCARTQMELRGMERSPKQLQLRVSESLQTALKQYCEERNVQQRALVEALLRGFFADQKRPVADEAAR